VGGTSLVIDVGVLTLLKELLAVPLLFATTGGLLASLAWNYFGQRTLTFRSSLGSRRSLPRYLLLLAFNYVVTIPLVDIGERSGAGYLTGKAVAVVLLTITNFYAYRAWVFPTAPELREVCDV